MSDPIESVRAAVREHDRRALTRGGLLKAVLGSLLDAEQNAREKALRDASRLVLARCASALPEGCGQCRICYAARELREEADRA